jgi:soluble lytic murein transglycosylase-like protein
MRFMADRSDRPLRFAFWFGLASLSFAAPAQAQVIEIGDDGAARTFAKPTRFIGGDVAGDLASTVTIRPPEVDRYERAAKAEGLDVHLLRAVAWTESRGRQNAVSPKGALGVMQLMPSTAAEMGVDPLDPDANLHGGARYLARQLSRFQSVPLALAAYNAGPGAVLRWGGIPPYAETQAYVAQILSRYQGTPASIVLRKIAATPIARRVDLMLIEVPSL